MMEIYTSECFDKSVLELTKKPKDGYTSLSKDIAFLSEHFNNHTFSILIESESKIVAKIRLRNSDHKLSKKDGYRVIACIFKGKNRACLIGIYPKRGKFAKENISKEELLVMIDCMISAL